MSVNEWHGVEFANNYARSAANKKMNWYEYEVNIPNLMEMLPNKTNSILDFGSGPGDVTAMLANLYSDITGTDVSKAMVEVANVNFPEIDFVVWDFEEFLSQNYKFDLIFSKLTLQFVDDLELFATQMAAIITDNGLVIFSVPHPINTLKKIEKSYWDKTSYITEIGTYGMHTTMIHRSIEDYIKPFSKHGFVVEKIIEPQIPLSLAESYKVSEDKRKLPSRMNVALRRVVDES